MKNKTKLKSGDLVKVISGKYKGLVDYIARIDSTKGLVYLKEAKVKVFDRSNPESKKSSQTKEISKPIHHSNVAYWLEDKKSTTRIKFATQDGKKIRKSSKFNSKID